jgi:glycosyltransferase involved in cell wall biosynthesis
MISVIVPLYNKEHHIEKSINSIINQTYSNFEVIIIDDGSSDNSLNIIRTIVDARIKIITQPNAGVSAARNRGINESKGEYITFLDADDLWEKDYLETQIKLTINYPSCDIFATNYKFRQSNGQEFQPIIQNLPFNTTDGVLDNYFTVASNSHPPITSISVLIRRKALLSVGGFPVGIRSGEDLLTWARLACRYNIAFSRKICAIYNLGDGYNYSNLPPRRQDENDPVGYELKKLMSHHPNIKGLKKYISHWHKMRASVAVRYGERVETIRESCFCLWYNPFNYKIIPLFVLALIPSCLRMALIHRYKNR